MSSTHSSLELSAGKCVTMSFYRKRDPFRHAYEIGGMVLGRVNEVRDLGVTLTESLCFKRHMKSVIA